MEIVFDSARGSDGKCLRVKIRIISDGHAHVVDMVDGNCATEMSLNKLD